MRLSNLNIIRRIGMHKVIKVCSNCSVLNKSDVKNGKGYTKRNVNSAKLSNKVMSRKRIRTIKRGC